MMGEGGGFGLESQTTELTVIPKHGEVENRWCFKARIRGKGEVEKRKGQWTSSKLIPFSSPVQANPTELISSAPSIKTSHLGGHLVLEGTNATGIATEIQLYH